jgi:hypothetical protein
MKHWRGEPDHSYWKRMPLSPRSQASLGLGFAAAAALWGVVHLVSPPHPPYTGKWGWFNSLVAGTIGWPGFAGLMFVISIALVLRTVYTWRASVRGVERSDG